MLVLHGAAAARDADRIEAALAPFRPIAAAVAPGAALKVSKAGPVALIATEAGAADPALFLAALQDLATAERLALAHSTLLNGLAASIDILPARLSGALESEAALIEQALARAEALRAGLDRIAGAAEYALRLSEKPAVSDAPRATPSQTTGRDYLKRKLDARRARDGRREAVDAFLDAALAAAESVGREVRAARGPTERRPSLVLDLAVLAPRAAEAEIETLTAAIAPRADALGLDFAAIGPWAPFSFADAPEDATAAMARAPAEEGGP